jgi:hypothetical protein
MITPSPTTKIDPSLARGTLTEVVAATATKAGFVKVSFPNTSYELHLAPAAPVRTEPGKKVLGVIRAKARRIDTVETGGRYVEPVFGRPRRVQGTVISVGDSVLVNAGVPIHLTPTDPRQKLSDFQPGQFISCDVMDGATFEEK